MPPRPLARPARILLCSWAFAPSIGGIETSSLFLAEQMHRHGIHVEVVTQTAADSDSPSFPWPVHRRPSRGQLLHLVRSCDLVYQNNISLHSLWPLLLAPKPLILSSHTPIDSTIERSGLKRWLKFAAMCRATCISCSHFLAQSFPVPSLVIHNPYRSHIFGPVEDQSARTRSLIFVGRLVQAKGLDILFAALDALRKQTITPSLTIVGSGGEQEKLKALTERLKLTSQITFLGSQPPAQLAELLRQHQILVVPSRRQPAEAFGIVALEGIACGTIPVVAAQGGLPEAIGPCGLTFETENPLALADTLQRILADPALQSDLRSRAAAHLAQFEEPVIFRQHLEVIQRALPRFDLLSARQ